MKNENDESFQGSRVLITGGMGFIGSTLAFRLMALGAEVMLVDSLIPEYGGNLFNINGLNQTLHPNIADVRDPHSMRYLVQRQNYLFNLAGQTSHMDSMEDPLTDLEINARAQLYIVEACRRYNPRIKIVYASTRQIYGRPQYLPVDEKHPLAPVDVNGINKIAGESYHLLYNNVHGIRTCALRLTNTYGPRMRIKDARQTFVGIWIRQVVEGRSFEVWGGEQLRDFTYVDDVVDAFLRAALSEKSNGKVYNVGGMEVVSLHQLAEILVEVAGTGEMVIREFPENRKKIDIGDYYSNDTLIREELGWCPQISLREGLQRSIAYYRKHLEKYL